MHVGSYTGVRDKVVAAGEWLPRLVARVPATVHAKLLVAFLATAALLITLGAVGLHVLSGVNRRAEDLVKRQERIGAYRQFQHDTSLPSSWSWNERTLEATLQQLNQFRYELDQLQVVAIDDADLLGQVRGDYEQFVKLVGQIVERVNAGDVAEGQKLQVLRASSLADHLERLTNELVNKAEADLSARMDANQAAYTTSRSVVIGFAAGSLALALVLGYAIFWSIIGPVKLMDDRLRLVGSGDFSQRVAVPNRDELGALAVEFNRMAAGLQDSYAKLEERTRQLTEALEQQTATGEILRVISHSPTDVQPVFDAIAHESVRLCGGSYSVVGRFDGELLHLAAYEHVRAEGVESMRQRFPMRPSRATTSSRAILERAVVHLPDVLEDPDYDRTVAVGIQNRSTLAVPMLRNGEPIGSISVGRFEPQPFTDKQIALLQTFADQAVIAIENVRLFRELEARTHELTRSVEELTALGEIGQAVSSSLDLGTVLNTITARAVALSAASGGIIYEYDEAKQDFRLIRSAYGLDPELEEVIRAAPIRLGEGVAGQAALLRAPVQVQDVQDERRYDVARIRAVFERRGYRSLLAVPLLSEQRIIGVLVVWRPEPGSVAPEVVNLLQTFATQSVIAIQNARLFREIDEKSRALEELSRNQEQLHRLSTALQEPLSLAEQLTRVLDAARQVAGLDRLYIWTLSTGGDGLMVSAQAGFGARDWEDLIGVTIPIEEAGALTAVWRHGEALLFNEGRPLPAAYRLRPPYSTLAGLRVKSFLLIPMIARGRTVGVLAADNRVSRMPLAAHTVDLLQTFAAQAAVAVENARLFQEIQDKSRELQLASKHKSQFLANMSHELRTPMNAVLGYTDLILDNIFGDVPEPIRETLGRIKTNGQHLLGLINDVLDLSKMEAGQLTLSLGEYAMGDVVHAVVAAVESLAAGKKLALKAIVPPDLPQGRGDERRLTQVLLNLAGNAIKFTDTGQVSIEARAVDAGFVVSVADTGPGIAEADRRKIFEEFQQADSSSTRLKGGSGLGLSISRRIVELHGGRIWVESAVGEGSTFYFTVPQRVERQGERA